MVFNGRAYDEITVGETFADALTVTETHIVLAAGMFGDFNDSAAGSCTARLPAP